MNWAFMESFSRGIFKNCKNTRSIYIYEELHNDHELTVKPKENSTKQKHKNRYYVNKIFY